MNPLEPYVGRVMERLSSTLEKRIEVTASTTGLVFQKTPALIVLVQGVSSQEDIAIGASVEETIRSVIGYGTMNRSYDTEKERLECTYSKILDEQPVTWGSRSLYLTPGVSDK